MRKKSHANEFVLSDLPAECVLCTHRAPFNGALRDKNRKYQLARRHCWQHWVLRADDLGITCTGTYPQLHQTLVHTNPATAAQDTHLHLHNLTTPPSLPLSSFFFVVVVVVSLVLLIHNLLMFGKLHDDTLRFLHWLCVSHFVFWVISDAREDANSTHYLSHYSFLLFFFLVFSSAFGVLAKRTTQLFHLIRLTEFESVLKMYDNFWFPLSRHRHPCALSHFVCSVPRRFFVSRRSALLLLVALPPLLVVAHVVVAVFFLSVAIISHLSRLRCWLKSFGSCVLRRESSRFHSNDSSSS